MISYNNKRNKSEKISDSIKNNTKLKEENKYFRNQYIYKMFWKSFLNKKYA